MPRIVKDHAVRRNEILDVAQRLITTSGYEQMTIQNILDELGISKGAFYHYFSSKQELLEAIIELMFTQAKQVLDPIIYDPALPALEKFERFFTVAANLKTARKDFVMALLKVWYRDDNALMRLKLRLTMVRQVPSMLAVIIRQGIQEGVMSASYPDQVAEVVYQLIYDLGEDIGILMLEHHPEYKDLQIFANPIAAYIEALERVLGVQPGVLRLFDVEMMREWIEAPETVL